MDEAPTVICSFSKPVVSFDVTGSDSLQFHDDYGVINFTKPSPLVSDCGHEISRKRMVSIRVQQFVIFVTLSLLTCNKGNVTYVWPMVDNN